MTTCQIFKKITTTLSRKTPGLNYFNKGRVVIAPFMEMTSVLSHDCARIFWVSNQGEETPHGKLNLKLLLGVNAIEDKLSIL